MGLFNFFNRQQRNGHDQTQDIESLTSDIPETVFIEKEQPGKIQTEEKKKTRRWAEFICYMNSWTETMNPRAIMMH